MSTSFEFKQPSYHIGNLGKDPELRFTPSGDDVVNFNLAVYSLKDENGKTTAWIRCTAWRELADEIYRVLKVGDTVLVGGKHTSEPVQDEKEVGVFYPPKYEFTVYEYHKIHRQTSYRFEDSELVKEAKEIAK